MIKSNLQLRVARFSDRKGGHPDRLATQILSGTMTGDSIMKRIKLTQGKFALVDDADFEWLSQWKWVSHKHRSTFYAMRHNENWSKTEFIGMHREILGLKRGDGKLGDHRNRNGLDNRRSNLRICTGAENLQNRGKTKNNTSGYKGVSWHKQNKYWVAQLHKNGKHIHAGCYKDKITAARAYDIAAIQYFGEFAYLNFPIERSQLCV